MANKVLTRRSIFTINRSITFSITKQTPSRSYISLSLSRAPLIYSSIFRRGPLVALAGHRSPTAATIRGFGTKSFLNNSLSPSNGGSNSPPLDDDCDFEHWLIITPWSKPEASRDEIIDSYIKILAKVVGSEDEARKKIYSVSTKHYFGFGALLSEELVDKIKELLDVWPIPDMYTDVEKKQYGGEPFINGQAVPYDPKYHAAYLKFLDRKKKLLMNPYIRQKMPQGKESRHLIMKKLNLLSNKDLEDVSPSLHLKLLVTLT
ncbi:hypothetical protein LguiA_011056 [Lonicera macranthoides]